MLELLCIFYVGKHRLKEHSIKVKKYMGIIKVRILMTHLLEFTLEFIKDYAKLTFLKSRLDIFEYLLD